MLWIALYHILYCMILYQSHELIAPDVMHCFFWNLNIIAPDIALYYYFFIFFLHFSVVSFFFIFFYFLHYCWLYRVLLYAASSLSLVASLAPFHCCFSKCIMPCYFIVMMMMTRRLENKNEIGHAILIAWRHATRDSFSLPGIGGQAADYTGWPKKTAHYTLVHIFAKYWPILIILSPT